MRKNVQFSQLKQVITEPEDSAIFLENAWTTILMRPAIRKQETDIQKPAFMLPNTEGSCVCLLVMNKKNDWPDFFADACFLPVQWRLGKNHDPDLPKGVIKIAEDIKRALDAHNYSLHLFDYLANHFKFDINVTAASAWAPLAASLAIAKQGGRVMPHIFATGKWTESGMQQVSHIKEKVECIRMFKELIPLPEKDSKPIFFVPYENKRTAEQAANGDIDIHTYRPDTPNWVQAMKQHLEMLHVPPDKSDDLNSHLKYLNTEWIGTISEKAKKHYLSIVELLANEIQNKSDFKQERYRRIALGLSPNYEVAVLLLHVFKPREAILLTSERTKPLFKRIENLLKQTGSSIKIREVSVNLREIGKKLFEIRAFLEEVPGEALSAVEITGGTKSMTALLLVAAQQSNSQVYYLHHETKNRSPVIGTEELSHLNWVNSLQIERSDC